MPRYVAWEPRPRRVGTKKGCGEFKTSGHGAKKKNASTTPPGADKGQFPHYSNINSGWHTMSAQQLLTQAHRHTTRTGHDHKIQRRIPVSFLQGGRFGQQTAPRHHRPAGQRRANGEDKYILCLRVERKQLVLNKTNWEAIEELHGDSEIGRGGKSSCIPIRRPTKASALLACAFAQQPARQADQVGEV